MLFRSSRALFARLIPQDRTSEFFGFYAVSERFATVFGPALFTISALLTGSSRSAILAIIGLFLAGAFVLSLVDEGRDPGKLKLWWHSHAREEVFWSGEDEETIEHFANDWMISLETNHRMKTLCRLDHYEVRSTTWVWVQRPAEPVTATDEEILEVRREIAGLIRRGPFAAPRGRD